MAASCKSTMAELLAIRLVQLASSRMPSSYYPPTLTGMHGSLARSINGVLVSCVDLIVLGTSTGHLGRWFEGAKF